MEYFVYIIRGKKGGTYTGFTTDLQRRLKEHNDNLGGYTKGKGPWTLVWYCVFRDRQMAENFEMYLKAGSGYAFACKRLIGK
ncbi:MAG: GIY-YIG nuclease family protein [bacterium]